MDDHEDDENAIYDGWSHPTPVELECIGNIESEEERISRLEMQREAALEKLWITFQSAAASLAHLYKGKD